MKALIRWGLRQRRGYMLGWAVGVSAFIALELSFFPSFKSQTASLNQTVAQLPSAVKSLIGDSGNYFSPGNYLNSRVFYLVVPLLFAILMIGLGSSLLAREEQDGTLELLLARPISRGKLLAGKALAGLSITGLIATAALIVCVGLSKAVGLPNSVAEIAAAMLLTYLLCLVLGAFAFMLTALSGKRRGLALGATTGLFASSYILTGLVDIAPWLRWPARALPYYYFQPQSVLSGHYTWPTMLAYTGAILIFALIAYLAFRRRDIG